MKAAVIIKIILFYLLFTVSATAVIFIYLKTGGEYTECLTDNYCLYSWDNTLELALIYTLTRIFYITAAFALLFLTIHIIRKKYIFIIGGLVCFATSGLAIFVLIKLTPPDEINRYIHIFIISGFITLVGIVLTAAHFKSNRKLF